MDFQKGPVLLNSKLSVFKRNEKSEQNYSSMLAGAVREAFKSNFWKNLGIWPNQVDPPPLPVSWDTQN